MKKTVFIAMCLFGLAAVAAHAQFTVNGLSPSKMYTLEQMKASLGKTPRYEGIRQRELGTHYTLRYGDDLFSFGTFLGFTRFTLKTNAYPVVVNGVTFRVGDNTSVLTTIPDKYISKEGSGLSYLFVKDLYDPIEISFNKSNIITRITYKMSIY
jgi:hypothetical protein